MTTYPIIANCNFESRDDDDGKAIHAARLAVEARLVDDADLIGALDELESILEECGDKADVQSGDIMDSAERDVVDAWTKEVQASVEADRQSRYVD